MCNHLISTTLAAYRKPSSPPHELTLQRFPVLISGDKFHAQTQHPEPKKRQISKRAIPAPLMELHEALKPIPTFRLGHGSLCKEQEEKKDDEDGPGSRAGYKSPQANLNSTLTGRPEPVGRRSRVGGTFSPSDLSTSDIKLGGGVAICEV